MRRRSFLRGLLAAAAAPVATATALSRGAPVRQVLREKWTIEVSKELQVLYCGVEPNALRDAMVEQIKKDLEQYPSKSLVAYSKTKINDDYYTMGVIKV